MMSVLEYAIDVNKPVSEILNLCKRLNISKYDYYNVYFNNKVLNLDNYFHSPSTGNNLEKELIKYKIEYEDFQNYVVCKINEYEKFLKDKKKKGELIDYRIYEKNIDIQSKFFWTLVEKENFQLVFSILIPYNTFKNSEIKNDYANTFNKMNQSEFKYSSLKISCEGNEIDDLSNLNINFNQIKRLSICLNNMGVPFTGTKDFGKLSVIGANLEPNPAASINAFISQFLH